MKSLRPNLRILVVEDDEDGRDLLQRVLVMEGHAATAAGSCAEARAATGGAADAGTPFDMMIADIGLPDGDGVELLRELRRAYLLTTVALTGDAQQEEVERCRRAGVHAFMVKPLRLNELHRVIQWLMIPPDVAAAGGMYVAPLASGGAAYGNA